MSFVWRNTVLHGSPRQPELDEAGHKAERRARAYDRNCTGPQVESGAFARDPKLGKKVFSQAPPWKRRIAKRRRNGALFRRPGGAACAQNANDHESERCAYIRRHPLKIVVATASAPFGSMLALCFYLGSAP